MYACNYYMVICVAVQLGTAINEEVVPLEMCSLTIECVLLLVTAINEEVV